VKLMDSRLSHLSAKLVHQRSTDRAVFKYGEGVLELVSLFGAKSKAQRQALLGLEAYGA
jgi:hypothetical protein